VVQVRLMDGAENYNCSGGGFYDSHSFIKLLDFLGIPGICLNSSM
jgi:hypothetical protein